MNQNNEKLNRMGFAELMQQPKPELCDYIMSLRGENVVYNPVTETQQIEVEPVPQPGALDPVIDAQQIEVAKASGGEPAVREMNYKRKNKKRK